MIVNMNRLPGMEGDFYLRCIIILVTRVGSILNLPYEQITALTCAYGKVQASIVHAWPSVGALKGAARMQTIRRYISIIEVQNGRFQRTY